MSQISAFGNLPGTQPAVETYEAAITWGPASSLTWWSGWIDANAIDSGNSGSTWRLRPGLVLGKITATGRYTNYSPTATDGSQVAGAVLAYGLRMQDVFSGLNVQKYYAIIVGGRVIGANLLGLDNQARGQMWPFFRFDDQLQGIEGGILPASIQITKTANYSVLTTDNYTEFNTLGAAGEVDFTLPAIANGYSFTFVNLAAQIMKVISAEGGNIVALNNLTANSVAFSTGGQQIGGAVQVYSNSAGTKWLVRNLSAGAATLTVA